METVDNLLDPLRALMVPVAAFLPRLAVALLVLLGGVLLAKAARFAIQKGLRAINVHVLTRRSGLDDFMGGDGDTGTDSITVLGILVYWSVILATLIVASNSLGLTQVSALLSQLMVFLPRGFIGLVIIAFGTYFARF